MDEQQSQAEPQPQSSESSGSSSSVGEWPETFDSQFFLTRIKAAIANPFGLLETVKHEKASAKGIYLSYLVVLVAIPIIAEFLRMIVFGRSYPLIGTYRWPFFAGLVHSLFLYIGILIVIGAGSFIAEKLAASFDSKADLVSMLKLFAISFTPAYVAGALAVFPYLGLVGLVLGIYGLYIFCKGLPIVVEVNPERRVGFTAATLVLTAIASVVIFVFLSIFSPSVAPEVKQVRFGDQTIELEEVEKGLENLQRMLPQQ